MPVWCFMSVKIIVYAQEYVFIRRNISDCYTCSSLLFFTLNFVFIIVEFSFEPHSVKTCLIICAQGKR